MPYNSETGQFYRAFRFVDERQRGDDVTRSDLDGAIDEVLSAVNTSIDWDRGLKIEGSWVMTAALGPYPLPVDPISASAVEIYDPVPQFASRGDYTLVTDLSAASGKGITFASVTEGQRVFYRYGTPVTLAMASPTENALVRAMFVSRDEAIAASILPSITSINVLRYSPASRIAQAEYRATNVLEWNTYPARLKFTDGGLRFWVIAERNVELRMAGAVGDGVTDDHDAVTACMDFFNLGHVGFDVHVGQGKFLVRGGWTPTKSGTWSGVNDRISVLKGALNHDTFWQKPVAQGYLDHLNFENIKFEGDWGGIGAAHDDPAHTNNGVSGGFTGEGQVFSIREVITVSVKGCTADYFKRQMFRLLLVVNAYFHEVKCYHGGQAGVHTQQCLNTIVTNSEFGWLGDDAVNAAPDDYAADGARLTGTFMMLNCRVWQCLKSRYGSQSNVIIDNCDFDFCRTGAITSTADGEATANQRISLTNLNIRNVIDASLIEPDAANNAEALVIGQSKLPSLGTGGTAIAAVPGLPDNSGNIVQISEYLNRVGLAYPTPGQANINLDNIRIGRTVAPVAQFSDYGVGLLWKKTGWYNPAFTLTELQGSQHVGIAMQSIGRNVMVRGIIMDGVYTCFKLTARALEGGNQNIVLADSIFSNYTHYGIDQDNTGAIDMTVRNVTFDGDPECQHERRNADGTWDSASVPTGCVGIVGTSPGMKVRGCTFRNLNNVHQTHASTVFERNTLECEPVAIGSASNKGIRVIPRAGPEFRYIIKGSNPSLPATWNTILNHCPQSASAMPSTGFWVQGARVENTNPVVVNGEVITEWLRITTGPGNTLNTDWWALRDAVAPIGQKLLTPRDFGASPADANSTAALQAWIDHGIANNEPLALDGVYNTSDLVINGPVNIWGWGRSSASVSASQPGMGIQAGFSAIAGTINVITIESSDDDYVWYPVLKNFGVFGNNIAERGVRAVATRYGEFDLWCERCRVAGLDLDDTTSRLSAYNAIPRYAYEAGSDPACRASHGLVMNGSDGTPDATRYHLGQIVCSTQSQAFSSVANSAGAALFTFAAAHTFQIGDSVLVYNSTGYQATWNTVATVPSTTTLTLTGVAFVATAAGKMSAGVGTWFGDIDSAYAENVSGSIYFGKDTGRVSRKNVIMHVAGDVIAEAGTLNTIFHINSEPSSITLLGAGAALPVSAIMDRTTGATYEYERYTMSQSLDLAAASGRLTGTATEGVTGAIGMPVALFANSVTDGLFFNIMHRRAWDNGKLARLQIYYTNNADAGNFFLRIKMRSVAFTGGIGSWPNTTSVVLLASATTNVVVKATVDLNWTINRDSILSIAIDREGADASDTATATMKLIGIGVEYESDGPVDGNWDFPKLRVA